MQANKRPRRLPARRMIGADLGPWQRRCGMRTVAEAAAALGLSPSTYRRMRAGKVPVDRPTELNAVRHEVLSVGVMLTLAEAALRVAMELPAKVREEIGKLAQNGGK